MKFAFRSVLMFLAAVFVVGWLVNLRVGRHQAVAAPPLSLDGLRDEKLDDPPEKQDDIKVDNSACYVCHGNYKNEPLVIRHGKEEIGCIDCHGESLDHRGDEDNIIPPEIMYAPEDIDDKCGECHDEHDAPAAKVLARWQERCPKKTDPKKVVCTDCHFQHRLKFRTNWWDKKTGKLIIRKEGQLNKPGEDAGEESME